MKITWQDARVFFRIMGNIAWSSIRHPLTTTVIDYETGNIIRTYTSEGKRAPGDGTNTPREPQGS